MRTWAWAGLVAQIAFVLSWVVAAFWQGPGYSALSQTISDMYAETAPKGMFLVVVITLCGLATILFALLALRPVLRASGWVATLGCVLLALSIYGIGDALSPFEREACRIADPGCSASDQLANSGGRLDAILSTVGIFLFIGATFVLAEAMKRTPGWQGWAWPARLVGFGFIALLLPLIATGDTGLGGLFERLLAAFGATAIAVTAARVLATTRAD